LKSLLYLNNQTVNAYSHIAGAAMFLAFPHCIAEDVRGGKIIAQDLDLLVLSVYCYSVAVCFLCSAV
jgi:adiponectin receptor